MHRGIWLTPRALGLHLTVILLVPAFLGLGWWQLHRALDGNSLSWAYTFEWPIFAGYALFLWWKLVHEPAGGALSLPEVPAEEAADAERRRELARRRIEEEQDDELAAYNRYLADLNASGRRKRW